MKNTTAPKYPIVLIEWYDSALGFQGWKQIKEQSHSMTIIQSVGFLIEDKKKYKVLYPHMGLDNQLEAFGSGDILIPTCAIKSIIKIKVPN